jgi:rhodanese-related sulfurtransferase
MVTKSGHPPPEDHDRAYEVVPGLYISGHPDDASDFLDRGVHTVIDLEGEIDTSAPDGEDASGKTLYLYWPIEDGPLPHPPTIRGIARFVSGVMDDDKKVLVHCRSGHNRSGMICARVLIEQGMSPDDAIAIVRERRRDGQALTNEHFVEWLQGESPGLVSQPRPN